MMRVKLIKMSVTVWHDCSPEFDCVQYSDEPLSDGRVFSDSERRIEKNAVELGKAWFEYDGGCRRPFWRASVILVNDGDMRKMRSAAAFLYREAIRLVKWDSVNFIKAVESMGTPSDEEIASVVSEWYEGNSNGRKSVGLPEFKETVMATATELGSQMAGADSGDYVRFFSAAMNDEIMDLLLKGLPLKIRGDVVEFESESAFNNAVEVIARKLSGDSVARFFETRKGAR